MTRDLAGRRLLVTGASSGIGRCIAEQAANRGARVVLAARSADKLGELAADLTRRGLQAVAVPADVTRDADRRRLLGAAVAAFGGLDALVNNAGIASFGHFATSTEEVLRQIMEVNFFAPAELMRLALPLLVKGHEPAVVNVASMCGRRGMPAWAEYSASKFALCGLSEALRAEFARFDIDVLLVLPGLTRSDLPRHLLRNEGRMKIDFASGLLPEEVAAGALRALERNRAETVLGSEAKWILRVNRFWPRLVDRLTARRVRQLYAS
ncbi:MAG TPA: SDR family NAD(P)-dependent oxidoreductase [Gemmataceae bacterium]|nr:SDR family NAD(P)-dependent oxidoreductase [Gemmataceae bacterium]